MLHAAFGQQRARGQKSWLSFCSFSGFESFFLSYFEFFMSLFRVFLLRLFWIWVLELIIVFVVFCLLFVFICSLNNFSAVWALGSLNYKVLETGH